MKRVTKLLSLCLVLMMVVGMLSACGDKEEKAGSFSDGGKVLNIRVWNDEFARRMRDHMPGYTAKNPDNALEGGTLGDITVNFIQVENQGTAYQDALDAALEAQANASGDDLLDIFLVEVDYAAKYVQSEYSLDVKKLGLTDTDLANQYQYTKDAVTYNGALKGVTWQACPAGLIYNREIAKEVLGTDDPAEVQKAVSDWATFTATAEEMKEAGYYMVAGYDDTFRVFSNNVSSKWVEDGKLNIDAQLSAWVDQTKEFTDKGYNNKASLWGDTWSAGFYPDGGVFCYFGPAWFIDFSMAADTEGSIANQGGWGLCEGPQNYFWGGTWICAASGTDNAKEIVEIMKAMTCNETVMKGIVEKDGDFINHKPAMEAMAQTDYSNKVLGGQNPLPIFVAAANSIELKNLSTYDQGCNETFQAAMKDYFDGVCDYETALKNFKEDIHTKYPAISVD